MESAAPRISADLLRRLFGFAIQEQAIGGLTPAQGHALQRLAMGKDVRMIVSDMQDRSVGVVNTPLIALIAEARELHQALLGSLGHNVASLANSQAKCRKRSAQLLHIATLTPHIIAQCVAGTQPVSLTRKLLLNIELPIAWREQRAVLGCA